MALYATIVITHPTSVKYIFFIQVYCMLNHRNILISLSVPFSNHFFWFHTEPWVQRSTKILFSLISTCSHVILNALFWIFCMLVTHSFDLLPSIPYHTKSRGFTHSRELRIVLKWLWSWICVSWVIRGHRHSNRRRNFHIYLLLHHIHMLLQPIRAD